MAAFKLKLPFLNNISVKDRAFLLRQLATMLGSGISLVDSIKVLLLQTKNPRIREALNEIVRGIESGQSFSAAIEKYPDMFNNISVAVVRSGEVSGKLEDVLLQLAQNTENEAGLVGKIKSAMVYPLFILAAMFGVAVLMMVRVMPALKGIFEESGAALPLATQILLGLSDFMVKFWWAVIIMVVAAVFGIIYFFKTETGTIILNNAEVRAPAGFGEGFYMARFTRTMSMLIKSGLPIIQALEITGQVVNNVIYRDALLAAKADVERGLPLSATLGQNKFFPKIVTQMILVGEQTGRLDQLLEKLALYYEDDIDTKIKGLSTLIEPVVIVILGIGVAFLVIAVLMPIYNISQVQ